MDATKLIIIRGPSGVGKSTVAKALMKVTKRPTVLIELDHYRFIFVNPPKEHGMEAEMDASDILIGLKKGFDVIFEGNFRVEKADPFLEIFKVHPDENYLFYLDASLDETLRRHENREDRRITSDKMREVYKFALPTGHKREVVIPEGSTLKQTVNLINRVAGLNLEGNT